MKNESIFIECWLENTMFWLVFYEERKNLDIALPLTKWDAKIRQKEKRQPITLHLAFECLRISWFFWLSRWYNLRRSTTLERMFEQWRFEHVCVSLCVCATPSAIVVSIQPPMLFKCKNATAIYGLIRGWNSQIWNAVGLVHATPFHLRFIIIRWQNKHNFVIDCMHTHDLHIVQWCEHKHYSVLLNKSKLERIRNENIKWNNSKC